MIETFLTFFDKFTVTTWFFHDPPLQQELQDKNDELQMEIEQLRLQLQRHENRRRNRRRRNSSEEESDDLINYEPNSLQLNHLLFVSWTTQWRLSIGWRTRRGEQQNKTFSSFSSFLFPSFINGPWKKRRSIVVDQRGSKTKIRNQNKVELPVWPKMLLN